MTAEHPDVRQTVLAPEGDRRWNRMERVVETMATGLGNTAAFLAESGVLFVVFGILWVAFGAALIQSQGSLDAAWHYVRGLPLPIQGVVWLLFLPVMVGLWVWEMTWPLLVRLALITAIAGWNLVVMLPRFLQSPRP